MNLSKQKGKTGEAMVKGLEYWIYLILEWNLKWGLEWKKNNKRSDN